MKTLIIIIFLALSFHNVHSQDVGEIHLCTHLNQLTGFTTGEGVDFTVNKITWYFITYTSYNPKDYNFKFDSFRLVVVNADKNQFVSDRVMNGCKGYPCIGSQITLPDGNYRLEAVSTTDNKVYGQSQIFHIRSE